MSGSSLSEASSLHDAVSVPVAGQGIAIVGVRKAFGSTQALRGVNFHARLGEIHAIVGGNGCGKSTLAKVISGVVPADSGQVSVLGLSPAAPHEARAAGIATVFQEVLVADECSVTENLYVGADTLWSRALSSQQKNDTAATLMRELAGMPIDPQTPVGSLPLNIKQWITIGRALLCQPRVLILDESSAALDLDSTERLFAKMRALRDGGCAVIIVTHRIAELIRVCDRATVLRDGVDVGVLQKTEITEKNLLRLMTGKAHSTDEAQAARATQRLGAAVLRVDRMLVWPKARPVRCRLRQGEILGVAGLDGQGQSEFVRMLAGVDPAMGSAPQVRDKQGAYVEIEGLRSAVRQGVSYVSGDRKREGIFANLSIYENLLMPLYRRKTRGGWLGLIAWSGLEGIFDWEVERLAIRMGERSNKITSLSGGNQQKVLIGRAFALNPDILILNDPARGIDVGAKAELYRHLREFVAQGKSVIYLSSEIEEFVGFCSRVLVFRNGSIFDEFSGPDIHPTPILEAMFGQTRAGQVHPVESDPDFEEEPMKIVEFGGDASTPQPGDADSWKRRSSPYPGFDKKPAHADAPSLEALRGAAAPQDAEPIAPPASPASARPKIKIMEFNAAGVVGASSAGAAPAASPASRMELAPASGAKPSMKIVEFDDQAVPAAHSAGAIGRSGIKIVEYGEAAKGSRS